MRVYPIFTGRSEIYIKICFLSPALMALAMLAPPRLSGQDPSAQRIYEQAGRALDAGESQLAIKLYRELLQQAPNAIEVRTNLGVALAHEGRYTEAIEQYCQ